MFRRIKKLFKSPVSDTIKGMNSRGFTLIELLVTIAIITILGGVALTAYIGSTLKAARSEAYANLESLRLLEERFFADNGDYAPIAGAALGIAACTSAVDRDNNVIAIQVDFPLFRPGNASNFCYQIVIDRDINDNDTTPVPCFHAIARGLPDSRVEGDVFDIDCNNDRTF
jgi:prepilin-type N-terminal cleavage/methylation domain-containing protein